MTSSGFIITVYCSIDPGDDTLHYASLSNVPPPESSDSTQKYILISTITCGLTAANRPSPAPHAPGVRFIYSWRL